MYKIFVGVVFIWASSAKNAYGEDPIVRPTLAFAKTFGSTSDGVAAVTADPTGNGYVVGYTSSADFPIRNGLQPRLGGSPLRVTADGGKTWSTPDIAPGVNTLARSRRGPDLWYAGTAGGIYQSVDAGLSWNQLLSAPRDATGAIVADVGDLDSIYAATEQGIIHSADAGVTWRNLYAPPPGGTFYYPGLVVHPARPARLFASLNYSLYRSEDAGQNWSRLTGMPVPAVALAVDPGNPDTIYAAAWTLGVYRSLDGGDTWTKTADLPVTFSRSAIIAAPGALYVATSNGVQRSSDGGTHWVSTSITASADVVAVDPDNSRMVYVAADQLYESTDGGDVWSPLLTVPPHSVAAVAVAGTGLLVGSILPRNIFITKWNADGSEMLYSTYLGGSYRDSPTAIATDRAGNLYVTGLTYSADFPVTPRAAQAKAAGPYSAFVAKISADGSRLLYSTLLGGSGRDYANAIAVDGAGNAYITGYTDSTDFPVTQGALQTHLRADCKELTTEGDAFVVKLAPNGGSLLLSTYLGGSCADQGMGIAVDNSGSIYVAGVTSSPDFPVTKNAMTGIYSSLANSGFVVKIAPSGADLTYASFLGTGWGDVASAVAVDDRGNAYVSGSSFGLDSPGLASGSASYTIEGFPGHLGVGGPAFLLKLNPAGNKVYSTSLGNCMTTATSVAVDANGRAWIAGTTGIPPKATGWFQHNCIGASVATVHPFQALGLGWGFVAEVSADGGAMLFSSLMDETESMALDPEGNALVGGRAISADLSRWGGPLLVKMKAGDATPLTIEAPQKKLTSPGVDYYAGFPAVVAPGAVVVLRGAGLGPAQTTGTYLTPTGTLTSTLEGVRVTFDGIPAPLISVQATEVICFAPFAIADRRTVTIQVENGQAVSNAVRVPVTRAALSTLAVVNEDGVPNSKEHAAAPGSVVTMYLGGLGIPNPIVEDGSMNGPDTPQPSGPVALAINWLGVEPLYYGLAPGQPVGIVQINFRIPEKIPGVGPWPFGQYGLITVIGDGLQGGGDNAPLWIL